MSFPFSPFGAPNRGFFGSPLPGDQGHGGADCRDHLRQQAGGMGGSFGFGPAFAIPFGSGFGRGGNPWGGRRGHRGRRGDVRAAILVLLTERPMHGYEMIQQIADRSHGLWRPSAGSVYPTLQLLADEDLIAVCESDGSKKLFELTDAGRAAAEKIHTAPWEDITDGVGAEQSMLRDATGQLLGAVAQAARAGSADQQQRIVEIVNAARRDVYAVLGESD